VDLERARAAYVGSDRVLDGGVRDLDRVDRHLEQVHDRRAAEPQVLRADSHAEVADRLAQEDRHLEGLGDGVLVLLQPGELDEQELLREREVRCRSR
jgi:hypothetical protein